MAKHKGYETVRNLIASGHVVIFRQVLDIVTKTRLAEDLGMHHQTFEKLLKDPEKFTFKQCFSISLLIEVDAKVVVDLIYAQCIENKRNKM